MRCPYCKQVIQKEGNLFICPTFDCPLYQVGGMPYPVMRDFLRGQEAVETVRRISEYGKLSSPSKEHFETVINMASKMVIRYEG